MSAIEVIPSARRLIKSLRDMGYDRYFLGSIIISQKDGRNYIIDGQQR